MSSYVPPSQRPNTRPAAGPTTAQRRRTPERVHFRASGGLILQTKLTVGASTDPLEREADAIADQVVRDRIVDPPAGMSPAPGLQRSCTACGRPDREESELQRPCAACSEPDDARPASRQSGSPPKISRPTASPGSAAVLRAAQPAADVSSASHDGAFSPEGAHRSLDTIDATPDLELDIAAARRSGGSPLDPSVRASLEPRFGRDLQNVRIHDDAAGADLARRLHARAFTVGNDLFSAPGALRSRSQAGRWLLAHELTHVVQQSSIPGKQAPGFLQRAALAAPAPESAAPAPTSRPVPDRFASCDAKRRDKFAEAFAVAAPAAERAHERSLKALGAGNRQGSADKDAAATREAFSLFFGDAALRDEPTTSAVLARVGGLSQELREIGTRRKELIFCANENKGSALAEYKLADRYYVLYDLFFADRHDTGKRAQTLIHEAAHHVLGGKPAGDLYTDRVSVRALRHISGLSLDKNPDSLAAYVLAVGENVQLAISSSSKEFTHSPDGSLPGALGETAQVLSEVLQWALYSARDVFVNALPPSSPQQQMHVGAIIVALLSSVRPIVDTQHYFALEKAKRDHSQLPPDASAEDRAAVSAGVKEKHAEQQALDSWAAQAPAIRDGKQSIPSKQWPPPREFAVALDRWRKAVGLGKKLRGKAPPGFGVVLSPDTVAAIGKVSLPIAFSEIGQPNTAVTQALAGMMQDLAGVPEPLTSPILGFFQSYSIS